MRCTLFNARFLYGLLAFGVAFVGGCHLEQGKLYFDEIGLDPITVYSMAPLEKTVYCLAEAQDKEVRNFDYMYNYALQEVAADPKSADWSELVCLSLSIEAKPAQLSQTIEVLDRIEQTQPQRSNPVSGFRNLMQQRLILHAEVDAGRQELAQMEQELVRSSVLHGAEMLKEKQQVAEQRKKIEALEKQVRELKEIELLLHPKQ